MTGRQGIRVRRTQRAGAGRIAAVSVATTLLMVLTGCSDDPPLTAGERSVRDEAPAVPAAKAYDPPTRFGEGGVRLVPHKDARAEAALDGTTAYLLTDSRLTAYNTRSGGPLWRVTGPDGMSTGVEERARVWDPAVPVVSRGAGRTLVLFAFQHYTEGTGTSKDVSSAQLQAVDAADGKVAWSAALPTPPGRSFGDDSSPTVVGVEDGTAVVTVRTEPEGGDAEERSTVTYAVNMATHHVEWRQAGFEARMVADGRVVGAQLPDDAQIDFERWSADDGGISLMARSLADGTVRWKDPRNLFGLRVRPLGAGLFTARVNVEYKEHPEGVLLLDAATGSRPAGTTSGTAAMFTGSNCVYDQRSVLLCGTDQRLAALDTRTHKVLWKITEDDPAREVPRLITAWHGVVYAAVDGRGGVLLDAATGKDRGTYESGYLTTVNEYGALDQDLTVFPATG